VWRVRLQTREKTNCCATAQAAAQIANTCPTAKHTTMLAQWGKTTLPCSTPKRTGSCATRNLLPVRLLTPLSGSIASSFNQQDVAPVRTLPAHLSVEPTESLSKNRKTTERLSPTHRLLALQGFMQFHANFTGRASYRSTNDLANQRTSSLRSSETSYVGK